MRLSAIALSAAVLQFASFAGSAADAPCTTPTRACTELVGVAGATGGTLVYRSYPLDRKNAAITRGLIVVHGLGRDADNYYRHTLAAAFLAGALNDTVLIVPRFASNEGGACKDELAPGELGWHCQPRIDMWRNGGAAVDSLVTTFDVADELLRKLARKDVFPNLRAIVVAGHSAGGQFVSRYEMANRVHESLPVKPTYVVANPSSYTYLDTLRPTPSALPASVAAGAPGYNAPLGANAPAPFVAFSDARNCTSYDSWPYGLNGRNGYATRLDDEQLKKQLVARADDLCAGRTRHSSALRFRQQLSGDGARTHPAGTRAGVRQVRGGKVRRDAQIADRARLRAQRALHVQR